MASLPETPFCSVIVPTLNRRDRLCRTLTTIRRQTWPELEIIVSDDGSSDGTADAVRRLGDPRVTVVRSDHPTGVAAARNRGADNAKGDVLAFCDDDDLWHPEKIAQQLSALHRHGAGWAYSHAVNVTEQLAIRAESRPRPDSTFRDRLKSANPIPGGCSNVICRSDWFRQSGGFDPNFSMFADWDLWLTLARRGDPAVSLHPHVLYVIHDQQMTSDVSNAADELARLRTKHQLPETGQDGAPTRIELWLLERRWHTGDRLEIGRSTLRQGGRSRFRFMRTMAKAEAERRGWQRRTTVSDRAIESTKVVGKLIGLEPAPTPVSRIMPVRRLPVSAGAAVKRS